MKKIILIMFTITLFFGCSKETPAAKGNITFWTSYDKGHGPVQVKMDGTAVGTISNWQAIAPSTCAQSNTLLVVSTTQGTHNITFTDSYSSSSVSISLTSECYIYKLW